MSFPTQWLRSECRRLLIAMLLPGWVCLQAMPSLGQVVIPNTATANFQDTPGGERRNVTSNQARVTARTRRASLEIVKTGDRASAEPGDTVAYRLLVRNTGETTLTGLVITDTLPLGLQFLPQSPRASLTTGSTATPVTLNPPTVNGRIVSFPYASLEPQQTLTLVYAAVVTPDAVRGSGRNLAVATGNTLTAQISSNTASHLLRIRPGILSDCGTVLGRVFVDKNFDGEQQPGEPGVPNAVIFMDDGNRVTTDANGLFSLAYVLAGYRSGTLDLTSVPGYALAPNLYRIEANSPSRSVRLSPGGMARMNFAVTPSFGEGQR